MRRKKQINASIYVYIFIYLEESSVLAGVIVDHNSEEGQKIYRKNLVRQ